MLSRYTDILNHGGIQWKATKSLATKVVKFDFKSLTINFDND